MDFATPLALVGLVIPIVLAGLLLRSEQKRAAAVARYEGAGGGRPLAVGLSGRRRTVKGALLVSAVVLLVVAAARPQWGSETQRVARQGVDVAVVLDVSTSMAARDLQPDRLGRAKAEARSLLDSLRGDRVGFVIFAGSAYQRFPLTTDIALAAQLIAEQPLGGNDVTPGTALDAGIRGGLDLLATSQSPAKAIVIFSDGEDLTGEAILAIDDARTRGVSIFAVGLGGSGSTIQVVAPATGQSLVKTDPRTGEAVITRLVDGALRRAASETGGAYTAVTPEGGSVGVIRGAIDGLEEVALESREEPRPVERFQIFAAFALLLLLAEVLVAETPSRAFGLRRLVRFAPVATGLLLVACAGGVALVNDQGNSLFDRGRYRDALAKYREVQVERPDLLEVHYNIGGTLYRLADYDRAVVELQRAAQSTDSALAARSLYAAGNASVRLGRLEDAVRSYRAALKLDPDDEDAKFNLELIQRRVDSLSPTPTPTPDATGTGSPGPTATESGTPGTSTPGTGTPGTGTPGTGTPGPATGTPGTGTPDPNQTPGPGETGTPGGTGTPPTPGEGEPGREVGVPEQPQGSAEAGQSGRSTEEQLRELLQALQNPELSPEDALRILDAYRQAQAAREAERNNGPGTGGTDDW